MSRRRSNDVPADVNSRVKPATALASSSYFFDIGIATRSAKNPTIEAKLDKNGPIDWFIRSPIAA